MSMGNIQSIGTETLAWFWHSPSGHLIRGVAKTITLVGENYVLGHDATITFLRGIIAGFVQQLVNESTVEEMTPGIGLGSLLDLL